MSVAASSLLSRAPQPASRSESPLTATTNSEMGDLGAASVELTHSQTQIWLGQRLNPGSPLYNMAFAFVLPAALETELFCEAWRRVVERSDALRTRLVEQEGGGVRIQLAEHTTPTEVLDFTSRSEPLDEFKSWCQQRCAKALSLEGALIDSVLVRLGKGRTGWYLNQHHLITDAWSTQLLFREVGAEYQSLSGGDVPAERASLADYYPTAESLQRGSAETRSEAEEHWAARSERAGRSVSFYGRDGRPVGTVSRRLSLELGEGRSRALDRLCEQDGFSSLSPEISRFALFATLLVSWLHRISGWQELSFDAPIAGRPTPDAKRSLGLFIELFPFAARVESGDTLRSLGARCLEEARRFLVHALPGSSAPSSAAASNVVLNYFPSAFSDFAGCPVEVDWVHPGHGDSVHALRVQVHDFSGTGGYTLHFDYNERALPERLRRRSLEHFEILLAALLEDPDRPIAEVDLLVAEERQVLATLNATDSLPLPERSVIEMFEAQAERHPGRVALRQGGVETTYAGLRDQMEELAAALVAGGLEPGDRVAILSRRSSLAVVAVLATLRARAAYVPIEARTPQARLDEILADSGARLLLLGDLGGFEPQVSGADQLSIAEALGSGSGTPLDREVPGLDELAYLMYTSGSTGKPKGVLIEHGGLVDYLCWADRQYVRGERFTFPLFTSMAFDLTVTSLFLPLITGGCLEIYPEPDGPVDTALQDVVETNAVDFIKLTPSHLSLLESMGLEGSRVRRIVAGGENLRTELAARLVAGLQDRVELYNEYGPTEAVVGCVAHRYDSSSDTGLSVPIGVPADHVTVEVLNEALTAVPVGVPGELWISRYGLARGYHGLDEITQQRFQEYPEHPAQRRYRTGDQVRMLDDGKLEYLGRFDRQLKVSGFRVEPGEIETALLSIAGIDECAVVARRHPVATLELDQQLRHCVRCGLPSNYPRAAVDEAGVCSICRSYESIKEHAQAYFKSEEDLSRIFEESARQHDAPYDCLMLYSGGKDSTYALCRLVDMGLSVYAFSLDNGFISEGAKDNVRRVTQQLGVPVELATTRAMNAIFRDSLMRFSNVCNGCFKTIYTLSMKRARELGIPIIVTGLSRGQMFETRLVEDMFRDGLRSPDEVDAAVLAARKVYHRVRDEVTRAFGTAMFEDEEVFRAVQFVDFFRYVDVGLDEMYAYLRQKVPWVRPEDTGRSTNCLINDVGIYVHRRERGFHNYALPYSWDVRLGHKTRAAALAELDDDIDVNDVKTMLREIGYDFERLSTHSDQVALEAFVVCAEDISVDRISSQLGERLPPYLIPTHLQRVDTIPLTASGKVDEEALRSEVYQRPREKPFRELEGPVEEFLGQAWQQELGVDTVGADDDFFELGGTSLAAMQVMLQLCREFDIDLPLESLFSHTTLGRLARIAEEKILADVAELTEDEGGRHAEGVEPPA